MSKNENIMADSLPIYNLLPRIKKVLAVHNSLILSAPTGSGKTTAVPIALLQENWLLGKNILLLEPRRLAARLAASYMAGQLGEQVGQTIGYRVRFDRKISADTRIEVITEGILTRRVQQDPELADIGLVIFDEFHERSLQSDLALAFCRDIQQGLREDLRLLIMSATLAVQELSVLLDGAEVIKGEGKLYPVENRYFPPPAELESKRSDHIARATLRAIRRALLQPSGDVLVFLPGKAEIKQVMNFLSTETPETTIVLPLHGGMKVSDQARAVRPCPAGRRRVILTTTIAETSLTIEGVAIVVDCGWKRVPRFDPANGLTKLETVRISRASARQRSGRAGRLGPGTCYRIWSKGVDIGLQPFDRPEILQADLASLVLELALWGVSSPDQLCWLNRPDPAAVAQAQELLRQLEALDKDGGITVLGRKMAELPVHPRLAHMLLQAKDRANLRLACDIAALISERDILRGSVDSVDLDDRLLVLSRFRRQGKIPAQADGAACRQVDRISNTLYQQLRKQLGSGAPIVYSTGGLLSLAFPDRIAAKRIDSVRHYKLVSGRGASLPGFDRLQGSTFLAVAAMDAGRKEGRIFTAALLEQDELTVLHGHRFRREDEVFFDRQLQGVRAWEKIVLGCMTVTRQASGLPDPEKVLAVMLAEIARTDLQILPWTREARELQQRIQCLSTWWPDAGWPDYSGETLANELAEWLGPYLVGMKTAADLRSLHIEEILRNQLDWQQQKRLDQEVPTHLRVPSGSRIRLQYKVDNPPVLAVRLQEMYGLIDTPTICQGRVKVLLHLLSPAGRPVQITDDLCGFWENSYLLVKKELKGRYPKHYWPDDPRRAEPTSRVKKRKRKSS